MEPRRTQIDIDTELVERARQVGAPSGRSASTVVEDAVRAFLGSEVIDVVRARNRGVDPEEVAALARSELKELRRERQRASR